MSVQRAQDYFGGEENLTSVRMNDDASLYEIGNLMQRRDASVVLEEYAAQMKWKTNDRIIDIGCADGFVTSVIKKHVPDNFEMLIGCDINERMVQYATQHYEDKRTKFQILDIEGSLPDELQDHFNHVFSFYTLHWIKNQQQAFTNIFNMLSKDGDCLLSFLARMPIFSVFKALSQTKKWGPWLQEYDNFKSPYHDSQEPAEYVEKLLKTIGFKNPIVKVKQMKFDYKTVQGLKNLVAAVSPFKIPQEQIEDFLEDYITVAREMRLVNNISNQEDSVEDSVILFYNLIVVYATKSTDT